MALCPNCGVELGESAAVCPLCRAPLPGSPAVGEAQAPAQASGYPGSAMDPEDFEGFSDAEKKKVFVEVFSISSLIASFVIAAVDLLLNRALTWSVFPLVSLGMLWLSVCIPFILEGRPWLVFAALGPALALFVFSIDLLDGGGIGWFPRIGGPIVALTEGIVIGAVAWGGASKRKGLNIIAMSILAGAVFCTGVEITLNLALRGRFSITWSAVVATAAVPVSGFLFYLHYRITNRASLRKLFHV
jgi:hypothetical protein